MANSSSSVFISHAGEDESVAAEMCSVLESQGFDCRYSGRDIPVGAEWDSWITEEIKLCKAVVVIVSEQANQSTYVRGEVQFAYKKKKTLIPFLIEQVEMDGNLGLHLERRERINAVDTDTAEKLTELAERLAQAFPEEPVKKKVSPRKPAKKATRTSSKAKPTGTTKRKQTAKKKTPASRTFRNPYEFDVAANSLTFKGRELETFELLDCVESNTHAAVFGLQRMGKTSLVEEGLHERLLTTPGLCDTVLLARVNLQEIGDDEVKYRDLMNAVLDSIFDAVASAGLGQKVSDLRSAIHDIFSPSNYDRGDRSEIFQKFAKLLRGIAHYSQRRIVLFIDEFSEVRKVIERNKVLVRKNPSRTRNLLAHDMFLDVTFIHQLGSLLKDRDLKDAFTLVVAVRPFMAEFDEQEELQLLKLLRPVTLYYLSEDAARSLILEPVEGEISYDDDAVSYLVDISRGHPYLLQFILKMLVDQALRENRRRITLDDVQVIEERMISDGPAFDAQFGVLISDYSVDEVTDRNEAKLGKGTLAIVAKHGHERPGGWVSESQIVSELVSRKVPGGKAYSLLSQLSRTKILEEESRDGTLCYRMYVPLLRKRFVKQNLYLKYFR